MIMHVGCTIHFKAKHPAFSTCVLRPPPLPQLRIHATPLSRLQLTPGAHRAADVDHPGCVLLSVASHQRHDLLFHDALF